MSKTEFISFTPIPLGLSVRHEGQLIGLVLYAEGGWSMPYSAKGGGRPLDPETTVNKAAEALVVEWEKKIEVEDGDVR